MARSIVCISQATGSGGLEIGHAVAERLGFPCLDEEIVALAAARERIDPEEVADVERRQTLVRRFLQGIERREKLESFAHSVLFPDPDAERPPRVVPLATSADHRAAIRAVIREAAEQGQVVIVSHAASIALADMPGLLRVLVTASLETRAQRISGPDLDSRRALKRVKETDRARADYLKRFYGVSREEPTHYDLVINTDVLGQEQAVDLIIAVAQGPQS
jgi:cytidylate kinase